MKNNSVKLLQRKRNSILEEWMKNQLIEEGLRDDLMTNDELRVQSQELLDELLRILNETNLDDVQSSEFDSVFGILTDISRSRARQGFSPRETGTYIFSLKDALLSTLQREIKDPVELYTQSLKISKLIDSLGIFTFEVFIKGREEVIVRQIDEIAEISNPVMRVWTGILALPIIGTLDSARTQVVMESLLQEIVDTESSIAILDISGVPAVDSLVAQHLIKTVNATRLMGAECIISGVRPEIAQTIVHMGIDLSKVITKSTLANALRTAFDMLQMDVVKKQRKV